MLQSTEIPDIPQIVIIQHLDPVIEGTRKRILLGFAVDAMLEQVSISDFEGKLVSLLTLDL